VVPVARLAVFAIAGLFWASYAALLSFFGGTVFEHTPGAGLLVALAISVAQVG
jgi:hypothetical protein